MISLHRSQSPLESATDSVMTRTVEGIINFWNRAAEDLYGWKKEEAIGKVSHDLLKTKFPKPLEEIESELVTQGCWEGKLVHSTRDGGNVVVESRWILDHSRKLGAVVEINAPYEAGKAKTNVGSTSSSGSRRISVFPTSGLTARRRDHTLWVLSYVGLISVALIWILYSVFAHPLIQDMYHEQAVIPFLNQIMEGRDVTQIETYHQAADRLMLSGTLWLITSYLIVLFVVKYPVGALLSVISFVVSSFFFFSLFEFYPSLIKPLGLDAISYYAHKVNYIDDDVLIYREKPFNNVNYENYRSENYSALYGIEVAPVHFQWITDKNGFRNGHAREYSDIVAIGDSYLEWGNSEAYTFVKMLENKLTGVTVTNLGKSGYGPAQYLEVLSRYGLDYRPKYVLMAFFEGNDVQDTKSYFRWKTGETERLPNFPYRMAQLSFLPRYRLALETQATFISSTIRYWIDLALNRIAQHNGYAYEIHPDLALLNLGKGETRKIKFVEELDTRSPKELLATEEWQQLKTILSNARHLSQNNGSSLILMYIPAAAHIYAQYSTEQSGEHWLKIRDQQIAAKNNTESAMKQIANELNIDLISLTPVLEEAARDGKLLYYPLDPHWNAEGTELAASFVAESLKSKYLLGSGARNR
jgi:PAS domain S-box